jgi:NitT/TauT family transport system substrate-binding protein
MLIRASVLALCAHAVQAAETAADTLRVGVLQFGTVNWELDVIQARNLAQKRGLNLKVVPLASGDASTVALQGGAVDVIVSDWIWVSRQRAEGNNFSLVPYSNAVGSVMVKPESGISNIADLKGRAIGISGGPFDKTWLLLRAFAARKHGMDLNTAARPVYAAPPLLNELAMSGQVDAALNVWHFDARLEVAGQRPLIRLPEILAGLGVDRPIPLIGWVFREDWAAKNTQLLEKFFSASMEAKALMAKSDAEWERLKPLMHAQDASTFAALRTGYRNGIPTCLEADYQSHVATVMRVLAETGGEKLVGKSRTLMDGTFWSGWRLPTCPKN